MQAAPNQQEPDRPAKQRTAESQLQILLVEDDDVAAEAVQRSLKNMLDNFAVTVAEDGLVALQILRGRHLSRRLGHPRIVLLDLNLPRMNGFELLEEIRADAELRSTIVFVLSTSDDNADRLRAYRSNIAGYIVKRNVGQQFLLLQNLLQQYRWAVSFPPGG